MSDSNNEVLISTKQGNNSTIGIITLNRPKALNALNLTMIHSITKALLNWRDNPDISAVVIKGSGDKAFCAGGDIKSLYTDGKNNPALCMDFFYHEYRLNTLIKFYPKPYLALLHGITMGGGIGVSLHGSHRVAAQNLTLAMPESGIGFFTDIGASYFLSRCKENTGLYLALTGNRVNCIDSKYMGLVDHILDTDNHQQEFDLIITRLSDTKLTNISGKSKLNHTITDILNECCNKSSLKSLKSILNTKIQTDVLENIEIIKEVFNSSNIDEIQNKINTYNSIGDSNSDTKNQWYKKTKETLSAKSPSSLVVIFEQLRRGTELDFINCMQMEYGLAYGFITKNDFYEGVRALLIDKDNKPVWDKIDCNFRSFDYDHYFNNIYSNKLELI